MEGTKDIAKFLLDAEVYRILLVFGLLLMLPSLFDFKFIVVGRNARRLAFVLSLLFISAGLYGFLSSRQSQQKQDNVPLELGSKIESLKDTLVNDQSRPPNPPNPIHYSGNSPKHLETNIPKPVVGVDFELIDVSNGGNPPPLNLKAAEEVIDSIWLERQNNKVILKISFEEGVGVNTNRIYRIYFTEPYSKFIDLNDENLINAWRKLFKGKPLFQSKKASRLDTFGVKIKINN